MARQISMPEEFCPVQLLAPAADAAGRTSNYVNLAKCDKAWIVVHINQGNAATVVLTPLQALDVSGTSSKGLTSGAYIWTDLNEGAADLKTKQSAATSYTTDAGTNAKIIIFEINPQDCMDMANGFHTIAIQTGASNAANITEATIYPLTSYRQSQPPTILS
jgi:hypothetical protein